MLIRYAQQKDLEAVEACVQAAYEKYIVRIGGKPMPMLADYSSLIAQQIVYILVHEEELQGVLVMMPQAKSMFVENIAIDPRFQGKGLGKALLSFVEQQARSQQLGAIDLYTHELMTENRQFYRHLGFEELEQRTEHGYRRVFLRKTLDHISVQSIDEANSPSGQM